METYIESIKLVRTRFLRGVCPKNYVFKNAISDPDTDGIGITTLIQYKDGGLRMMSPFTLRSWFVNDTCLEVVKAKEMAEEPMTRITDMVLEKWGMFSRLGMAVDYAAAEEFLNFFGIEAPEKPTVTTAGEERKPRGKGKQPDGERFKSIKTGSKRAEVAEIFAVDNLVGLEAVQRRLKLTRSGLLSHLHCIHKYHGVGYELGTDSARLLFPEGKGRKDLLE